MAQSVVQRRSVDVSRYSPDNPKAFEWLGKSLDQREGSIRYLKVDPRLDGLRADPRYASLLARAGLSP